MQDSYKNKLQTTKFPSKSHNKTMYFYICVYRQIPFGFHKLALKLTNSNNEYDLMYIRLQLNVYWLEKQASRQRISGSYRNNKNGTLQLGPQADAIVFSQSPSGSPIRGHAVATHNQLATAQFLLLVFVYTMIRTALYLTWWLIYNVIKNE